VNESTSTPAPVSEWAGRLSETPLPAVLRHIFRERLTGVFSVSHGDETRHLFFEKGELRNATSSREGQRIGAFLKRRGQISDTELQWALDLVQKEGRQRLGKVLVEKGLISRGVLEAEMRRLVEEIVFSTFAWTDGTFRFRSASGRVDPDIALTLSTATIVVEGIRRLPESDRFLELIGDLNRVPAIAEDPMSRYQYLPLAPQEAYLLSQIDGRTDARTLLKLAPGSRPAGAKILYALLAAGLVEMHDRVIESLAAASPVSIPPGLDSLNIEIAPASPAEEAFPAAVLESQHRKLVRNTYRRIDWLSHYDLLGIAETADGGDIDEAFHARARLFHPDLRHRADLADCGHELTVLFERLQSAYNTLSDARARSAYDRKMGQEQSDAPVSEAATRASQTEARRTIAAQNYRRAKELIDEQDYFPAVELLQEAVRFASENAEYRYVLGKTQLKNPRWKDRAISNLKEAAHLDPLRGDIPALIAEVLLDLGNLEDAAIMARRAVELSPENREFREIQERIEVAASSPRETGPEPLPALQPEKGKKRGLLRRMFGRS
jgi:tetratricopeptide (TPR) repeat protein